MSINSFWISTTARTGSMWLYNVTKEILKLSINPKKANYYGKNSFNRVDKFIWNKELLKIYD